MIIPAVIPKSLPQLKSDLSTLSFQDQVQIDVVDGKFVPNTSWPYEPSGEVAEAEEFLTPFIVEVDLMVADPLSAAREWIECGAAALVFHLEGLPEPPLAIKLCHDHSVRVGFAISNDSPLDLLTPYINDIDFVQVMGIGRIGAQGEAFDSRAIERVTQLRSLYPQLEISVDGAVKVDTILPLKEAGATRFVVGSEILEDTNREAEYDKLLELLAQT